MTISIDMPRKGKKSIRGEGDLYDTPKKRYNFMLTETARAIALEWAQEEGISASELLERILRARVENPKATPAPTEKLGS